MTSVTRAAISSSDLNWLVNDFTRNTPGVAHAVVVSSDGVVLAVSERLDRAQAARLAAIVCGAASLADGVASLFDTGDVRQVVVEMAAGLLLVMDVYAGSHLATIATATCDIGVVAYQATVLAAQAGEKLSPALRAEPQASESAE